MSQLISLCRDPGHLLALGLGSGLAPKAPGTFGSALAALLALPLMTMPQPAFVAFALAFAVIAIPLCGRTAHALGVHDHPAIVADEFAGLWLALLIPVADTSPVLLVGVAFLWFRLFDIAKPGPIGWLDRRLTGGLGIVADDLAAGLAALAAVHGTFWLVAMV